MTKEYSYHRYVEHHRIEDYLRLGWLVSLGSSARHPVMDCRGVLLSWICPCELVEPR